MNRSDALTYLTNEFKELATDARFEDSDRTDTYTTAIDNSLRQLGVSEDDLATAEVAQSNVTKFLALLEYFALKRFVRLFSVRVSVSLPGPVSAQRNQAFAQAKALLEDARAELAAFGVDPGGAASFQLGRMTLDFLEPSCEV